MYRYCRSCFCSVLYLSLCTYGIAQETLQPIRFAVTTSIAATDLIGRVRAQFVPNMFPHTAVAGSGHVLRLLAGGDIDIAITHAPALEEALVQSGVVAERIPLFFNRFVILGPHSDPAGIAETNSIFDAMHAIARTQSLFISRGDNSGTHNKERLLWGTVQPNARAQWYLLSSVGALHTVRVADVKQAYTLVDTASARMTSHRLRTFAFDDRVLHNVYALSIAADAPETIQIFAAQLTAAIACVLHDMPDVFMPLHDCATQQSDGTYVR